MPDISQLSPHVLTLIEQQFVDKLTGTLASISQTALVIFYTLATIELVLFGLMWAFKREEAFGDFIFKVLKIGLVFAAISMFPAIVQALIDGFTYEALKAVPDASGVMLQPAMLWHYGFDAGIALLKLSVQYGTANVGVSLIYLILGFGTLLLFALLGIQIILVMVLFYMVAMLALLLLPFGVFSGTSNFFERAFSSLFKAGTRVFVTILVMGVAIGIWSNLPSLSFDENTTLMQPLGLFFSALVFAVLAYRLPGLVVEVVGEIRMNWMYKSSNGESHAVGTGANVYFPPNTSYTSTLGAQTSSVAAATSLSGVASGWNANTSTTSGANSISVSSQVSSSPSNASPLRHDLKNSKRTTAGSNIQGISRETLKQLKTTFKQAIKESK